MKKFIVIMVVVFSFALLISCNEGENTTKNPTEEVKRELTPIEQLTEEEKILFDALIKASETFYEPSAIKLLSVGDREVERGKRIYSNEYLGPGRYQCVVVRLQGENKIGGTLSHYYKMRVETLEDSILLESEISKKIYELAEEDCKKNWDNCEPNEFPKSSDSFDSRQDYKEFLIDVYYKNDFCTQEDAEEYFSAHVELYDSYTIDNDCENIYNVAKINSAIKYYWDERLGNN